MAGAGELRQLRRRIRSVEATRKSTRAMELIAASRIAKAREAVEAARPYAQMITRVIRDLTEESEVADHPLFTPHETISNVGVIVITSDRGLAGAYNANALRRAGELISEEEADGNGVKLYCIGGKADAHFRYRNRRPDQAWTGMSDQPRYRHAQEVSQQVFADYSSGAIDRVWLVFTDFRSALNQVAAVAKLMPIDPKPFEGGEAYPASFEFEPEPTAILERLLPRYIEHRLYAGLLESAASEHASRQRAMKSATDNAGEVIEQLTREQNRARQAMITTEITEIVGGAEALENE